MLVDSIVKVKHLLLLVSFFGDKNYGNTANSSVVEDIDSCHPLPPQFPLGRTNHTLKWEGVWRELGCLARSASFAVREESGHSLKSALSVRPHFLS